MSEDNSIHKEDLSYQVYKNKRDQSFSRFHKKHTQQDKVFDDVLSFHKSNKTDIINNDFFLITNKSNELVRFYDFEIFSRYQRQGHNINSLHFFEQLYSQSGINSELEKTFFLTSCQAIHYSLFKSVLSIDPNSSLLFGTDRIYFETLNAWKALSSGSNKLPHTKKIFLLDSAFIDSQNDLITWLIHPRSNLSVSF